jgi:hypothetical protein
MKKYTNSEIKARLVLMVGAASITKRPKRMGNPLERDARTSWSSHRPTRKQRTQRQGQR